MKDIKVFFYCTLLFLLSENCLAQNLTVSLVPAPAASAFKVEKDKSLTIYASVVTNNVSEDTYMIRILFKRDDGVVFTLYNQTFGLYNGYNNTGGISFTIDNNLFTNIVSGVTYAEVQENSPNSLTYISQSIPTSQTASTTSPGGGGGTPSSNFDICCNQCILRGQTPALLTPVSGAIIPDGASDIRWWFCPEDYVNQGIPTDDGHITCQPNPTNSTVQYQREVVYPHPSGNSYYVSNAVIIYVSALDPTLSIGNRNYTAQVTQQAFDITINGQLTSTISGGENIIAANSITILPNSLIAANINLTIQKSLFNCNRSTTPVFGCSNFRRSPTNSDSSSIQVVDEQSPINLIKNEITYNHDLVAYPNPTTGQVVIKYSVLTKGTVKLYITDNMGKSFVTLIDALEMEPGEYEITLNTKTFESGLYLYTLETDNYKETKKLVITQ